MMHRFVFVDPYYNIPRTSSLPRSLGKKHNQAKEQKSMTLPRKKVGHILLDLLPVLLKIAYFTL